jgi:hypothetical protein
MKIPEKHLKVTMLADSAEILNNSPFHHLLQLANFQQYISNTFATNVI